jgi:sulfate transport system permease protein
LPVAPTNSLDVEVARPPQPWWSGLRSAGLDSAKSITGKSLVVGYLSLLILIPVAALVDNAFKGGLGSFWSQATSTEALDAIKLTVLCSFVAAMVNAIAGTATAYVLVRDRFIGRSALNAIIDLPFALPTVVAGITFYTLYGPHSPFHVNITGTWIGVTVAIMFVTLPFSVRSVEPVLESLTIDAEAAASTLGASSFYVFRTITLPAIMPALLTGTGLAFARALGEYGSVVFISNNIPYHSEIASSYVYSLVSSGQNAAAASVAMLLLVGALCVLIVSNVVARRLARRRG